jgi:hypothetical protein
MLLVCGQGVNRPGRGLADDEATRSWRFGHYLISVVSDLRADCGDRLLRRFRGGFRAAGVLWGQQQGKMRRSSQAERNMHDDTVLVSQEWLS